MLAPNPSHAQRHAPLLVTAREAAQMLAMSERKLFTLTHRGDIPRVRIDGRMVRYAVDDLEDYVARQRAAQK